MVIESLVWLIPSFPLLAFFLISIFTFRKKALSHWIALGSVGLSWMLSMVIFFRAVSIPALAKHPITSSISWLPLGNTWFQVGIQIDPLSAVTLFFVAWTVLMIFVYSVGYHNYGSPDGDGDQPGLPPRGATVHEENSHAHRVPSVEPMYSRFFAFIALFAFGMYLLVVTDNLLVLYMGWEIMGLCSYLLIGFWFGKESARNAAVKAFLTTRVGDMFMLLGLVILYSLTGSLNYQAILANSTVLAELAAAASPVWGLSWAGLIGLLLFAGTIGKSAQFPLHIWLPDAMEGPTPVSAMIHAATMVSAGVYLVIRFFPLLSAGWQFGSPQTPPMQAMAFIGAFTALMAATIALAQRDIKRVLAYSTISQLGYMIAALGVGAYIAATFHLVAHAFFKALLFLGSGSVIHGMEHGVLHENEEIDPQDMFNMGGLRRKMPVTFWTFLIGGLALSGFPVITAGFWSKDAILSGALEGGHVLLFITLALAALLTAFYTMRQIALTFLGNPRTRSAGSASETSWVMTLPLVVLAVFAVVTGWSGIPTEFPGLGGIIPNWFGVFVGSMIGEPLAGKVTSPLQLLTSLLVSLGGLSLGWLVYHQLKTGEPDPLQSKLGGIYTLLRNKYYIDEIYSVIIIRPCVWLAEVFTARWVDGKIIDGIIDGLGKLALNLGKVFSRGFDLPVITGSGNKVSEGVRGLGLRLRSTQTGYIQQYMIFTIVIALVIIVIFYLLLV